MSSSTGWALGSCATPLRKSYEIHPVNSPNSRVGGNGEFVGKGEKLMAVQNDQCVGQAGFANR